MERRTAPIILWVLMHLREWRNQPPTRRAAPRRALSPFSSDASKVRDCCPGRPAGHAEIPARWRGEEKNWGTAPSALAKEVIREAFWVNGRTV